jgi:GNAT superfamily N-acetyltransferase
VSNPDPPAGYSFGRFDSSIHSREEFDCEVQEINIFLKTQVSQAQERYLSSTSVLISCDSSCPHPIIGYVTLCPADVPFLDLPQTLGRGLPKNRPIPALLLARLGIDRNHKSQGLGKFLVKFAFLEAIEHAERVGCVFLFVDTKAGSRGFYLKYGFEPLPTRPDRLVIPIARLVAAHG